MIVTSGDVNTASDFGLSDMLLTRACFLTNQPSDRGVILLIVNIYFPIIVIIYITFGCWILFVKINGIVFFEINLGSNLISSIITFFKRIMPLNMFVKAKNIKWSIPMAISGIPIYFCTFLLVLLEEFW